MFQEVFVKPTSAYVASLTRMKQKQRKLLLQDVALKSKTKNRDHDQCVQTIRLKCFIHKHLTTLTTIGPIHNNFELKDSGHLG